MTILPTVRESLVEAAANPSRATRVARPRRERRRLAAITVGALCAATLAVALVLPGARAVQTGAPATGQPVARSELAVSLQWRARCSWYRLWLRSTGHDRSEATAALPAVANWSSVGAGESRAAAVTGVAAARSGDPGPIQTQLAVDC